MEIASAYFARLGESLVEGSVAAIGAGLTALAAPQLPSFVPSLAVVLHLLPGSEEIEQDCSISIELVEPAGQVMPAKFESKVKPTPSPVEGAPPGVNLVFNLFGLPVMVEGRHVFRVTANDREIHRLAIYIGRPRVQTGAAP